VQREFGVLMLEYFVWPTEEFVLMTASPYVNTIESVPCGFRIFVRYQLLMELGTRPGWIAQLSTVVARLLSEFAK
jgi:hypothetical protein